jgi:hypothetical protein
MEAHSIGYFLWISQAEEISNQAEVDAHPSQNARSHHQGDIRFKRH